MVLQNIWPLLILGLVGLQGPAPRCESGPGRMAEQIRGEVSKGVGFSQSTPSGWILRLVPDSEGWFLEVTTRGRETEDLSRLTPPWHFVPNPREIQGGTFETPITPARMTEA